MAALRIVFAGSPAAAVPSLQSLASTDHHVVGALTRNDSRQGRRGVLTQTPAAIAANALDIPVIKANRLDDAATEAVGALAPDLGVIVAYGALVKQPLLSTPRLGWINLHFSLLPRWRGAAPVQHAIMAGDDITGASVFQLVPELDAGDVFGRMTVPIGKHQTAGALLDSLAVSGAELLTRVVSAIADGTARAEPQEGDVTLAPKLSSEAGEIDWTASAETIVNLIRAVTPEPGASTLVDGARLKVLQAARAHDLAPVAPGAFAAMGRTIVVGTATEPIELLRVQPAGRTAMDAAAWWRGRPQAPRAS
jgi:methionyl-tRNA formyltransferase